MKFGEIIGTRDGRPIITAGRLPGGNVVKFPCPGCGEVHTAVTAGGAVIQPSCPVLGSYFLQAIDTAGNPI